MSVRDTDTDIELRWHAAHWGPYLAASTPDGLVVRPHPDDPDPSPILANLPDAAHHPTRVAQPMVRKGWLDRGPGPSLERGAEAFVPLDWPAALDLVANELRRVRDERGGAGIYGGSYGWSSAGRFHHAQSQLHRFLGTTGGYVRSVNTYSSGCANVILPHVLAEGEKAAKDWLTWPEIEEHTELVVAFGGMARKNASVSSGGVSRHLVQGHLERARERGAEFVLVSPLRDDLPGEVGAEWIPIRPATDVALMLALAHTLVREDLHDREFLDRCTAGYERFERYLLGETDGVAKSPRWAEEITGISAGEIAALARRMAGHRTLVTVSHSLQRSEFGEQPVWMGVVLAAMLGQLGLPGGGFQYALASLANNGKPPQAVPSPALPQGRNPVRTFIPVARVADMLLHPGEPFEYDGQHLTYPDIRLVYWAGGNPFHHHQDLARLRRAFARPDTVIVHDAYWTSTARHADVVLPSTITLEREDIGGGHNDSHVLAMHRVLDPYAQAWDDYAIFSELARRLDASDVFTEGRTPWQWLQHLYGTLAARLAELGVTAPPFDEFWELGSLELPARATSGRPLDGFREDPDRHPLTTPSGKVEIFSETIAGFGYDDCPGHPTWLEPAEWLGSPAAARHPLQLVANQPATRLHSQLDVGGRSQASKVAGREPVRIHPDDAAARGIRDGDVVRVFNDRGACLAGAVVGEGLRPGVVQLSTGAWYDPLHPAGDHPLCVQGNPNVLTRDVGTSRLAQGCTGQLTLVEVERFQDEVPAGSAHLPPAIELRSPGG